MRGYLIALVVLIVVTMIMATPEIAMVALFATLGLALPLWYVATAALYMMCLLPLVLLWKRSRIFAIVTAVACLTAVAVIPSKLAKTAVQPILAEVEKSNITTSTRVQPRTIEVVRESQSGFFSDHNMCGPECRGLLLSGRIDWIRNVQTKGGDGPVTTFHEARRGSDCKVEGAVDTPEICIVPATDPKTLPDLYIRYKTSKWEGDLPGLVTLASRYDNLRTVSVALRGADGEQTIYRRASLGLAVPTLPTLLRVGGEGMHTKGIVLEKTVFANRKITFRGVLNDLGYGAVENKPVKSVYNDDHGPDSNTTRELIALLDSKGVDNFSREESEPIRRWITAVRNSKKANGRQIDLLKRIVRETRFLGPDDIDQVFSRIDGVATALLPVALDVLSENNWYEGYSHIHTPAHSIGWRLANIDKALLKPHRDQIIDLSRNYYNIRSSLGRLDIDPAPHILPVNYPPETLKLDNRTDKDLKSRLHAACLAEDRWSSTLLAALQEAADDAPTPTGSGETYSDPREYRLALSIVLARYGDLERAERLFAKEWSKRSLKNFRKRAESSLSIQERCRTL